MILLLTGSALADTLLALEENFDSSNTSSFSGSTVWASAYSADDWSTQYGDDVWPWTDSNGGPWGADTPADNALIYRAATFGDMVLNVSIHSDQNDAQGVAFHVQDSANYYLFFITGDTTYDDTVHMPGASAGEDSEKSGAFLYAIVDGVGVALASASVTRMTDSTDQLVQINVSGGDIDIYFDENANGAFVAAENILSVSDSTYSSGSIGLYAYDCGGDSSACAFDDVEVYVEDTDGDDVADTEDNCPTDVNTDQSDIDGDGIGDACDGDADGDGYSTDDCDDSNRQVNPGIPERCDTSYDDDCDGDDNDEGAIACITFTRDADGDGFGTDARDNLCLCAPDAPYTASSFTDCDDSAPTINPDAEETCNELDDDCDGSVDEGATTPATWYRDDDGDGFGREGTEVEGCSAPADEGWVLVDGDCNDGNDAINPLAEETCDDVDQDCDGVADEGAVDAFTWYVDADSDGHGDAESTTLACDQPSGYAASGDDCDDADATRAPGADETCNERDDDCDAEIDEDAVDGVTVYTDADSDGYGDESSARTACDGAGLTTGGDCDDLNPAVNPAAEELADGVDEDCDGRPDDGLDSDGDGLDDDVEQLDTHTDPNNPDTDGDGQADGAEIEAGTNPNNPHDPGKDGDGVAVGQIVGGACGHVPARAAGVPLLLALGMLLRRRRM